MSQIISFNLATLAWQHNTNATAHAHNTLADAHVNHNSASEPWLDAFTHTCNDVEPTVTHQTCCGHCAPRLYCTVVRFGCQCSENVKTLQSIVFEVDLPKLLYSYSFLSLVCHEHCTVCRF